MLSGVFDFSLFALFDILFEFELLGILFELLDVLFAVELFDVLFEFLPLVLLLLVFVVSFTSGEFIGIFELLFSAIFTLFIIFRLSFCFFFLSS